MSSNIQSANLLKAIETAIPAEVIEQAIGETNAGEERARSLPAHLVVSQVNCNESIALEIRCGIYSKI